MMGSNEGGLGWLSSTVTVRGEAMVAFSGDGWRLAVTVGERMGLRESLAVAGNEFAWLGAFIA